MAELLPKVEQKQKNEETGLNYAVKLCEKDVGTLIHVIRALTYQNQDTKWKILGLRLVLETIIVHVLNGQMSWIC